jgi:hypothetical protein
MSGAIGTPDRDERRRQAAGRGLQNNLEGAGERELDRGVGCVRIAQLAGLDKSGMQRLSKNAWWRKAKLGFVNL